MARTRRIAFFHRYMEVSELGLMAEVYRDNRGTFGSNCDWGTICCDPEIVLVFIMSG